MAVADATAGSAADPAEPKLKRDVGMVGLLFVSVGSIIGSGWLFGALSASQIAGPLSAVFELPQPARPRMIAAQMPAGASLGPPDLRAATAGRAAVSVLAVIVFEGYG